MPDRGQNLSRFARDAPAITRGDKIRLAAALLVPVALVAGLAASGVHAPGPLQPHLPHWRLLAEAPLVIRLHVAAALTALTVGVILLSRIKGDVRHKALGWTWVTAMAVTSVGSLFIRVLHPGHWSYIHLLSGWTIIALPIGVLAIRRGKVQRHRRMMTGVFVGGLVIAGAFTFVPGRLMFAIFFG